MFLAKTRLKYWSDIEKPVDQLKAHAPKIWRFLKMGMTLASFDTNGIFPVKIVISMCKQQLEVELSYARKN